MIGTANDGSQHTLVNRPVEREDLRLRLRETCTPAGSTGSTPADAPPAPGVPAAVLVGLVAHPDGPRVILTERTAHLKDHAAQISLPGGRIEPGDDGPVAAALREALEEIGLPPENVEILGCLPPRETVSGFLVYPVVGWIDEAVHFTLEASEVADAFEVPLSYVLDPANHRRESLVRDGVLHEFYVIPYPGRRIWGATAEILVDLSRVLTRL
jgi:8-oxo-dGTP pyrophosphatase MutT (NUDIX family)